MTKRAGEDVGATGPPLTATARRAWWRPWGYATFPALGTLAVTLWGLASTPLWLDELSTLDAVTKGPLTHSWEPMHVPYYLLMRGWVLGWTDIPDWWLRLPSALSMAAAAFLVAVAAKQLAGRRAGFTAGVLFALMPGVSRYGQEARSYALVTALAAAATLALIRALPPPASRKRWLAYGLLVLPMGILHPVSLAILAGHAVIVGRAVRSLRRAAPWLVACAGAIPGLLFATYNVRFAGLIGWIPRPPLGDAVQQLVGVPLSQGWLDTASLTVGLVLVVIALTDREGTWWLVAYAVPVSLVWLVSHGPTSFWIGRYLLAFVPLLAIAAGISAKRASLVQVGLVGSVLALVVLPSLVGARKPSARGPDYPALAGIVVANYQTGDSFLGQGRWQDYFDGVGLDHYLGPGRELPTVAEIGRRVWTMGDDPTCRVERTWSATGATLRLCETP